MSEQPALWTDPTRKRKIGRARRGFDKTVSALRETGRIEKADEAVLALGRIVTDLVDETMADRDESRFTKARVLAEARAMLMLIRDHDDLDLSASLEDLLAAPLGDAEITRPSD